MKMPLGTMNKGYIPAAGAAPAPAAPPPVAAAATTAPPAGTEANLERPTNKTKKRGEKISHLPHDILNFSMYVNWHAFTWVHDFIDVFPTQLTNDLQRNVRFNFSCATSSVGKKSLPSLNVIPCSSVHRQPQFPRCPRWPWCPLQRGWCFHQVQPGGKRPRNAFCIDRTDPNWQANNLCSVMQHGRQVWLSV